VYYFICSLKLNLLELIKILKDLRTLKATAEKLDSSGIYMLELIRDIIPEDRVNDLMSRISRMNSQLPRIEKDIRMFDLDSALLTDG
jgi:hypothetical protein